MNSEKWLERAVKNAIAEEAGIEIPKLAFFDRTIGGEAPFDRFERLVREWAEANPDRVTAIRKRAIEKAIAEHEERIRGRLREYAGENGERRRLHLAVDRSGIGERTGRVLLAGNLKETQPLKAAREWVRDGSGCLLLLGVRGTGKTVAAADAMVRLTGSEYDACFCDACCGGEPKDDCLVGDGHFARARRIEVRWYYDFPSYFVKAGHLSGALHVEGGEDVWRKARRASVLVIDDLGREYADVHGRWVSELDLLIDDRHESMLRTIITSNLSVDEFKARYGERIADRIRQDGKVVVCAGESLRRAG